MTSEMFVVFLLLISSISTILIWRLSDRVDELEEKIENFEKEFSKGVIDYTKNISKYGKIPSRQQPNKKIKERR